MDTFHTHLAILGWPAHFLTQDDFAAIAAVEEEALWKNMADR